MGLALRYPPVSFFRGKESVLIASLKYLVHYLLFFCVCRRIFLTKCFSVPSTFLTSKACQEAYFALATPNSVILTTYITFLLLASLTLLMISLLLGDSPPACPLLSS